MLVQATSPIMIGVN